MSIIWRRKIVLIKYKIIIMMKVITNNNLITFLNKKLQTSRNKAFKTKLKQVFQTTITLISFRTTNMN